jgi:hypothetical protein
MIGYQDIQFPHRIELQRHKLGARLPQHAAMIKPEQTLGIGIDIDEHDALEPLQPVARHHPSGATTDKQELGMPRLHTKEPVRDQIGRYPPLPTPKKSAQVPA